jgi:hypothetical protein
MTVYGREEEDEDAPNSPPPRASDDPLNKVSSLVCILQVP